MLTSNQEQHHQLWYSALLVILIFFGFYFALGCYPLLNNNEGLYASIAKHMLLNKAFIIPHLNCVPYIEKPPLLYWLLSLSFTIFGFTEFAARFVTASSAALLCGALLYFNHKIKTLKTGLMAVLIFASSIGVSIIARMVYFDMLLTFLVGCNLCLLFYWYETKKVMALRIGYIFFGLTILTKGLVAIILIGGTFGLYLLLEKSFWKCLRQSIDWPGIVLFLAVVLPWHIAAVIQHKGFFWNYIISEHFLRFLDLREPHDYYHGTIYYYLPRITVYLFPWSLFIPLIFLQPKGLDSITQKLLRFCWCWLLVPLIFFSLSKAKANYYMIVSMPALATILSIQFHSWFASKYAKAFNIIAALILFLIAVGSVIFFTAASLNAPAIITCKKLVFITIAYCFVAGSIALFFMRTPQVATVALAGLIIPVVITGTSIMKLVSGDLSAAKTGIYLATNKNSVPIYLYQDLENISAVSFYANSCLKIIDSRSNDLYYGASLPQSKPWFLTKEEFLQKTKTRPYWVVVPTKKLEQFYQNLTSIKITILQKYKDLTTISSN